MEERLGLIVSSMKELKEKLIPPIERTFSSFKVHLEKAKIEAE